MADDVERAERRHCW